ncbi:CoA-binding protein [uncultured Desulfobacter sp.]|uniref:CoA-binding protein n=1 Tax=uncultured Desulfobacter sp. TaxID=240139 RepID=UPI002AABB6F9|nr:CoA-binding protein [uncultured Desulfobacter sp.]
MSQTNPFPYYVGVNNLQEIANKETRCVVMNILGGESKGVTPTSHEFSGGNIVAGVQYGKSGGKLETKIGDIPAYGSIKEIVDAGIKFDTGVIYLPPTAVAAAAAELIAQNPDLTKIVILTEKVGVKDAAFIRAIAQENKIDVFGGNCLGIGNSWDQVRVGGALGGNNPGESLVKGSVAVFSNSGNFSTTIPEYLKTAGFGTSTVLSSGKDLYIHFAFPEFLYCAENDPRTKAIFCYIEPGGYYEKLALDWIADGTIKLTKPIVACVTGRWKANLSRAVGHAGAIAGGGDDALAKEKWFDSYFGVDMFNPDKPKAGKKGVRIESIQDAPTAMAAVYKEIGENTDFAPFGDLSLKPWFVNEQGLDLPAKLKMTAVEAMAPYNEAIKKLGNQVGAQLTREAMRNKSGASRMNPKTDVTEVHGVPVLDLVVKKFALSNYFAVSSVMPDMKYLPLANAVMNYFTALGTQYMDITARARANGALPNAYLGAAVLTSGNCKLYQDMTEMTKKMIDLFYVDIFGDASVNDALATEKATQKIMPQGETTAKEAEVAAFFGDLLKKEGLETVFTQYAQKYAAANSDVNKLALLLAAMNLSLIWTPLVDRQMTVETAHEISTYLACNGVLVGCCAPQYEVNDFYKSMAACDLSVLNTDFATTCFKLLFNREPADKEQFAINGLLNLLMSNGPGTISAKGAKESVSGGNFIATCYSGWMNNTGRDHGGNGFEAIKFLKDAFGDFDPYLEPDDTKRNAKMKELAQATANKYLETKQTAKREGVMNYFKVPCVNHPVFKGKPVNYDPREVFMDKLFTERNEINHFQVFYHYLVQAMFDVGATKNVFCVNIDGVIATISLDLLWKDVNSGKIDAKAMQDIAFIMFLLGRMVGCSAEIADHKSRGNIMDCRTPASQVEFVG